MSCKYHRNATSVGECAECGKGYCAECGVSFTSGTECLDCAAKYARKKVVQSYVAAGIGFVLGIIVAGQNSGEFPGFVIPLLVVAEAYVVFGLFWGWHYGGRLWPWLGRLTTRIEGTAGLVLAIIMFGIRFWVSLIVGCLGGGIAGFLWARGIVNKHAQLAHAAA